MEWPDTYFLASFLMAAITLEHLRRYAVARSLFTPTTLSKAIERLGFVQADPIRAPARAQDLTLRHRVREYRAGDLERRYPKLGLEEDFFVNYGFLQSAHQALMHPRVARTQWSQTTKRRAQALLEFICEKGEVHPREVDDHFSHGLVTNHWGGSSSATTQLLDAMHYRGLVRVTRRVNGTRIYSARARATQPEDEAARHARLDQLVDVIVCKYCPLPAWSLNKLVGRLRYGTPQWTAELKSALQRGKERLANVRIEGVDWYWPAGEKPHMVGDSVTDEVRMLTPFDPVVWDRRRFEMFWGWAYRFEAYTPASKRKFGYYALPLLWRDRVIGWGNLSVKDGALQPEIGHIHGIAPRDRIFRREFDAELQRIRDFVGLVLKRST